MLLEKDRLIVRKMLMCSVESGRKKVLHTVKRRKAKWIGHMLRRNCLLKHFTIGKVEGRIEMTGKRERIHKQLLEDRKERKGYWKFIEEAPDRSFWRTRFGISKDL